MARKKSLWSELQRERERRQRVARAQERTNEQTIRQIMRDHDRAERQAARADAAERKRQVQLAHEAGASAAKAMKARLDARLAELRTLLTSVLDTPPQLSLLLFHYARSSTMGRDDPCERARFAADADSHPEGADA